MSRAIGILFHLPVIKGWLSACDTVILFSGSKINILSRRSLKLDSIFGSSPGKFEIKEPMSFGLMFKINLFTACKHKYSNKYIVINKEFK